MVNTVKFSQFASANLNDSSTQTVGIATGQNIRTPKVVTWTTAGRPTPPFNGVLGLNTDLEQYEYWDSASSQWVQLASSVDLTATYILKTPDGTLPNSFALSTLSTGILKNTTGTGVPTISAPLTSIDSLVTSANQILYTTGSNVYAVTSLSPFSRGLLADTTATQWRTDLGVPGLPVNVSQGGTGDTSFTAFALIAGGTTSTNPLQSIASVGTAGQVLTSNGAGSLPTFQAPSSSGSVNPGLINQLAYYASSGSVVSGLATANNGVLVTDNSGVPSISSTIPLATQSNITQLGTITTGTWNGSIIALAFGGTNANLTASAGAIVYSTASAFALSAVGTTGQLLQSNGAGAPTWTTATFPGTVGSTGTILRSNGTNWIASTATFADTYSASNILYSSGANNVVGLATANNGVLITSAGGVPSISSTLPLGVQTNITELGTITLGTWNGTPVTVPFGGTGDTSFTAFSVICGGTTSTGNLQNVSGVGSVGQVLTSQGAGALPQWVNAPGAGTINSGLINELAYYAAAGTTLSGLATSPNGLLVTSNTSVPSILGGPGTTGNILQSNASAAPSFSTATYPSIATGSGTILRANGTNWVASTATFADTYTASNILYSNGANTVTGLATANNGVLITSAGGVPSISSTLPTAVQDNITRLGTITSGVWNGTTIAVANGGTGVTASDPVIQRVSTQTGAVATGTTTVPYDDTIPQNTEGDEYMSLAITPKNSGNILKIEVKIANLSSTAAAGNVVTVALFQDSTANALAAANVYVIVLGVNIVGAVSFTHTMTAGTTSSTTFKVRAGASGAGTTTFNGVGGGRIFGGVMASSITITEYAT